MAAIGWTQLVIRDKPGRVDRVCFGRPVTISRRHRPRTGGSSAPAETLIRFAPDQCFGLVRWRRDPAGGQRRVFVVLQAIPRPTGHRRDNLDLNTSRLRLPDIDPEVKIHLLLEQLGPAGSDGVVDRMLDLIGELNGRRIDVASLKPSYFREVAHRLMADGSLRWPDSHDFKGEGRS
ncbi:MAG: DUF2840 domain-containing protein [Planctomycetota bacterium]